LRGAPGLFLYAGGNMRGHQDRVNRVSQENMQQQLTAIVEHRVD
jgi:hypothetical protein